MAGFKTVKRDGIELTGTLVATVNADLSVGALEETLTVSAQSPTVDVQSVLVQQTLSSDVISAIPSSRNASGIQSLIPGLNVSQAGVAVGAGGQLLHTARSIRSGDQRIRRAGRSGKRAGVILDITPTDGGNIFQWIRLCQRSEKLDAGQ